MKVLIVPDVHGRVFWKDILPYVNTDEYEKIIFLGDYVDPYTDEKISEETAFNIFNEIVDLKKNYPDKIVLLLGNHDLGYIDENICQCRRMEDYYYDMRDILKYNKDLFNISYSIKTDDKTILFSHAGFTRSFVSTISDKIGDDDIWACIDTLDEWYHQNMRRHNETVNNLLGICGRARGGYSHSGSCVWADINETIMHESFLENTIQIFGHTMLKIPYYTSVYKTMYCIDSQRVFVFDTDNYELSELNKDADKKDN